jgi:predicted transcriptional regulator
MAIQIIDEQLVRRIKRIARRERREEVDVIAQAVELYEEKTQSLDDYSFLLSVAGLGRSQEGDVSERDEDILSQMEQPVVGPIR